MYLTSKNVDFQKLGLPDLGTESSGAVAADLQHSLYKYFALPSVLYVALAGVIWRNRKKAGPEAGAGEGER